MSPRTPNMSFQAPQMCVLMDYITPISPVQYAPSARITTSAPHAKCDENTCNERHHPIIIIVWSSVV